MSARFRTSDSRTGRRARADCLFEGQPFTDASSFTIEEQDVQRLSLIINPNLEEAGLDNGPIRATSSRLRSPPSTHFSRRPCSSSRPLAKEAPEEIAIGREVLERLGGGGNITVEVALCWPRR